MSDKHGQARRYAQAVFEAMVEQWQAALFRISAIFSENQQLYALVMDGSKDLDDRLAALEKELPDDIPQELANLLKLLVQEGDLDLLPDIATSLAEVGSGQQAPTRAEITSADELSEKQKETLRRALTKEHGEGLVFTFHVDPSLMGGLRVRVGDRLTDTSIASRLATLRESFTSVVR